MDNEIKDILVKILEGQSRLELDVKKIDLRLEDLDKKVELSLEGHKTNTEQLDRIEKEVSKHEEFILKRVQ